MVDDDDASMQIAVRVRPSRRREVVLHSRRSVWNGRAAITGGEGGKQ